jgi:O-acetyl-ADP-ribose deacetylase (regulator of RNase III)
MTRIAYVTGDATAPMGADPKIIAHICNDADGWGAGFVLALSKRWPQPEQAYRRWAKGPTPLALGMIQIVPVEEGLYVANMVAQHGYRSAANPTPLDYAALRKCLSKLVMAAYEKSASVHMPRIGADRGGGKWSQIEEIIEDTLVAADVPVTVYDLPRRA